MPWPVTWVEWPGGEETKGEAQRGCEVMTVQRCEDVQTWRWSSASQEMETEKESQNSQFLEVLDHAAELVQSRGRVEVGC